MKLTTLFLILFKQLFSKWGRFLLASGGIMIGIWAIILTTSLSTGVLNTLTSAINSQADARLVSVQQNEDKSVDLFGRNQSGPPKFVAFSQEKINQLLSDKKNDILDIKPNVTSLQLNIDKTGVENQCFQLQKLQLGLTPAQTEIKKNCITFNASNFIFDNFYDNNKANWLGKTQKLTKNEIALCFTCGELGKKLGYETPEKMLNQKVTLDFNQAPKIYAPDKVYDISRAGSGSEVATSNRRVEFTIAAVIDDRNNTSIFNTGAYYLDFENYIDTVKQTKPDIKDSEIGFLQYDVYLKDYSKLADFKEFTKGKQLLYISTLEILLNSVQAVLLGLSVVLAGFGLIALIASIFGIVNVMTISVLERQKEIGILKSMGSTNFDIFRLFLFESALLGFIGWLLGFGLAFVTGLGISQLFNVFAKSDSDFGKNLANLNITSFSPEYSWWLLVGTLVIALTVTALSGLFPSLKAARQNPVDVLRSE